MDVDVARKGVDQTKYRGLIGSLLYLTASRPDIMFVVCLCARYQANPKESHFKAAKRILKYLKGTTNGDCEVKLIETKLQLADIFTKPLPKERFFVLRNELGMLDSQNLS